VSILQLVTKILQFAWTLGIHGAGTIAELTTRVRRRPSDAVLAAAWHVGAPPGHVVVGPLDQDRGVVVEERDDPRSYRDPAGLAVHVLIPGTGCAQETDLPGVDAVPAAMRHVQVVGRVLPLEDRRDGSCPAGERGSPQRGGLLEVAAPQGRADKAPFAECKQST
jgi:hypothetical protein